MPNIYEDVSGPLPATPEQQAQAEADAINAAQGGAGSTAGFTGALPTGPISNLPMPVYNPPAESYPTYQPPAYEQTSSVFDYPAMQETPGQSLMSRAFSKAAEMLRSGILSQTENPISKFDEGLQYPENRNRTLQEEAVARKAEMQYGNRLPVIANDALTQRINENAFQASRGDLSSSFPVAGALTRGFSAQLFKEAGLDPQLAYLVPTLTDPNGGTASTLGGGFYDTGGSMQQSAVGTGKINSTSVFNLSGGENPGWTVMHEQIHAFEHFLTPAERQELDAIMAANPLPEGIPTEHHPPAYRGGESGGGLTDYFDYAFAPGFYTGEGTYQIPQAITQFMQTHQADVIARASEEANLPGFDPFNRRLDNLPSVREVGETDPQRALAVDKAIRELAQRPTGTDAATVSLLTNTYGEILQNAGVQAAVDDLRRKIDVNISDQPSNPAESSLGPLTPGLTGAPVLGTAFRELAALQAQPTSRDLLGSLVEVVEGGMGGPGIAGEIVAKTILGEGTYATLPRPVQEAIQIGPYFLGASPLAAVLGTGASVGAMEGGRAIGLDSPLEQTLLAIGGGAFGAHLSRGVTGLAPEEAVHPVERINLQLPENVGLAIRDMLNRGQSPESVTNTLARSAAADVLESSGVMEPVRNLHDMSTSPNTVPLSELRSLRDQSLAEVRRLEGELQGALDDPARAHQIIMDLKAAQERHLQDVNNLVRETPIGGGADLVDHLTGLGNEIEASLRLGQEPSPSLLAEYTKVQSELLNELGHADPSIAPQMGELAAQLKTEVTDPVARSNAIKQMDSEAAAAAKEKLRRQRISNTKGTDQQFKDSIEYVELKKQVDLMRENGLDVPKEMTDRAKTILKRYPDLYTAEQGWWC